MTHPMSLKKEGSEMTIVIVISVVFALFIFSGIIYLNIWLIRRSDYQCNKCGAIFSLSAEEHMTIHKLGNLYVQCKHCGQMCWAHPVPKRKP